MINLKKLIRTSDDDLLKKFPGYTRSYLRGLKKTPAKILVFDIETAPLEVFTWGLYQQDVAINQIENDWFMLCWSAKWLFDDTILSDRLTPKEALKKDDRRISESLWNLLDEADIVIAHNGDSFDIKKANSRFLKHGLGLPNYFQSIDTLKIAKKEFRLTSNKLDYICRYLGIDTKLPTEFSLWRRCYDGDKEALERMSEYCDNDVKILEELYLALRPYIRNHPNLELYTDGKCCPNCGSPEIEESGLYRTQKHAYIAYRCECGALSHRKD